MNANTQITFGTYEGWGYDELYGGNLFKAIREIESNEWEEEQSETYHNFLGMVEQARKEFYSDYFKRKRSYRNARRMIRMNYDNVFSVEMEEIKKYIETRFPKSKTKARA